MSLVDKRVAILADNYFEQAELEVPLNALKEKGVVAEVISVKETNLQALIHVDKGDKFIADLLLEDADPRKYDGLILPGGAINADSLRINDEAKRWAAEFLDSGKMLAVICHAPWLLVSADLVDGRTLTSFHTIQDDIINAGGNWVDKEVVVDDNLITSRQPDDLPAFISAILSMLNDPETTGLTEEILNSYNSNSRQGTLKGGM